MSRSAESPINSSGTTELAVNQDGSVQTGDKIRILIADDHTSVLAGLSSIIGMQPDMVVVAEAENGPASRRAMAPTTPRGHLA